MFSPFPKPAIIDQICPLKEMEKRGRRQSLSLFLIVLSGFFLRLLAATNKDFWFDEAISFAFAKQNLNDLFTAAMADNHPPLYYLLLHFWLKLSQSEIFLRLPSIIFGTISIYLVYLIAKNLINEKVALFSSLLFALSPLHVYYSAEARMYSPWTFFILVCFYFFLKILKRPKSLYFFLFTFSFLLSLYTHYFSIIFFLSLNIFLFLKKSRFKKQFFILLYWQLLAVIIFLSWFLNFLSQPHPKPWHISPMVGVPATFVSFILGGLGQVSLKAFFLPTVPFLIRWFFICTAAFFILLFLVGTTGKEKLEEKTLLLLLVFFPILVMALISFFYPIYSPRPFLIFAPFFYILVAIGLMKLNRRWVKNLTIISLFLVLLIQNFYPPLKSQTLKDAVIFIKENSTTAPVVVHTDILTFYPFAYYFQEADTQFLIFPSELTRKTTDIIGGSPVSFTEATKKAESFWSVHFSWDEKTRQFKKEQPELKRNFKFALVKTIDNLEIFHYEPK